MRSWPGHSRGALLLQRILQAADGVLDLALYFVALAFGDQLAVTEGLADRFLEGALGLLGRAGDTIFVHVAISPFVDALAGKSDGRWLCRWSVSTGHRGRLIPVALLLPPAETPSGARYAGSSDRILPQANWRQRTFPAVLGTKATYSQ